MRLVILSERFYDKYRQCEEILRKTNRPYFCVSLKIEGTTFAIPLRHHIKHPFCFHTVGDAGLDFSKSVIIKESSDITEDAPWIETAEWNVLKKHEKDVIFSFRKYYNQYLRALRHECNPRSAAILQYSTLRYFIVPQSD